MSRPDHDHAVWLFDVGNSRLKFARLMGDGGMQAHAALPHRAAGWRADAAALPRGEVAYIANVAGATVAVELLSALSARFARISLVRSQARLAGLRIAYRQPERLGVDRFLALLAAHLRLRSDVLLVGVGTALTIDLLAADGRHHGGRIAPSPASMRAALHARARHLPAVGGARRRFAADTADALASGCDGAALALVADSLRAARRRLRRRPLLVLHGGGADALRSGLPQAQHLPDLVLDGLADWVRQTE